MPQNIVGENQYAHPLVNHLSPIVSDYQMKRILIMNIATGNHNNNNFTPGLALTLVKTRTTPFCLYYILILTGIWVYIQIFMMIMLFMLF